MSKWVWPAAIVGPCLGAAGGGTMMGIESVQPHLEFGVWIGGGLVVLSILMAISTSLLANAVFAKATGADDA